MKFMFLKKLLFYSAFLCIGIANAQTSVSGTISDRTGPLPGATVVEKGTMNGTQTDFNGNYTINNVSEDAILVFSFIGYVVQEVSINGKTSIDVNLLVDSQALEEVVVIGYGTMKKKEITSAVASVQEKDFNPGGVRSPMELIQGKVAGLNITRTQGNNPNAGTSIQLRGVTSLTGTRSPLIVIDGIPGGNLDLLQQDDIKSIDVLKDGSAAAIYGTRGNAGVILITTKKGRSGETLYEYNNYFQREYVDKKPDYLNPAEYRDLISQGIISSSQDLGSSTDLYDELVNVKFHKVVNGS